jgi:hypothetical protein
MKLPIFALLALTACGSRTELALDIATPEAEDSGPPDSVVATECFEPIAGEAYDPRNPHDRVYKTHDGRFLHCPPGYSNTFPGPLCCPEDP